jgi:hypothetical protein
MLFREEVLYIAQDQTNTWNVYKTQTIYYYRRYIELPICLKELNISRVLRRMNSIFDSA